MLKLNIPPLTTSTYQNRDDALRRRFNFTTEQAHSVRNAVGRNGEYFMVNKYLHIKSLGFARDQIVWMAETLQQEASRIEAWQGVSKFITVEGVSIEIAYLAWRAGLTRGQLDKMNPESRTRERLSAMASLNSI